MKIIYWFVNIKINGFIEIFRLFRKHDFLIDIVLNIVGFTIVILTDSGVVIGVHDDIIVVKTLGQLLHQQLFLGLLNDGLETLLEEVSPDQSLPLDSLLRVLSLADGAEAGLEQVGLI